MCYAPKEQTGQTEKFSQMEENGWQQNLGVVESDGRLKISIDNVKAIWYNQTDLSGGQTE